MFFSIDIIFSVEHKEPMFADFLFKIEGTFGPKPHFDTPRNYAAMKLDGNPLALPLLHMRSKGVTKTSFNPFVIRRGPSSELLRIVGYGREAVGLLLNESATLARAFGGVDAPVRRVLGEIRLEPAMSPQMYSVANLCYARLKRGELTDHSREGKTTELIDRQVQQTIQRSLDNLFRFLLCDSEDLEVYSAKTTPLPPTYVGKDRASQAYLRGKTVFQANSRIIGPVFVGYLRGRGFGQIRPLGTPHSC